jgi:excisionase family DNA binding protein
MDRRQKKTYSAPVQPTVEWLSASEAAGRVKHSPRWIWRQIKSGKLRGIQTSSGRYLIRASDLDAFLNAQEYNHVPA